MSKKIKEMHRRMRNEAKKKENLKEELEKEKKDRFWYILIGFTIGISLGLGLWILTIFSRII